MKAKNAWKQKLVACITAAAMVVTSWSLPTMSVFAEENDAAVTAVETTETVEDAVAAETVEDAMAAEPTVDEDAAVDEAAVNDAAVEATEAEEEEIAAETENPASEERSDGMNWECNGIKYAKFEDALAVAGGNKNNVITLLGKDGGSTRQYRENITIDKSVTVDLGHNTLMATLNTKSSDFGPIYITTLNPDEVVIRNGIVMAEIDGWTGFKAEQIKYSGHVELSNITLLKLEDDSENDNKGYVAANLWTDGHDYDLYNCDFSNASIQNIWSDVTIHSGKYLSLNFHEKSNITDFGTPHDDREFHLEGGEYTQKDIDEYITDGHKKIDDKTNTETLDYVVVNNDGAIPNQTVKEHETGHSITIKAEPGVQYSSDKDGAWYYIDTDGSLKCVNPNGTERVASPADGVVKSGDNLITFTKDDNGTLFDKATGYPIYSRYPAQVANPDNVRVTPLLTGKVDAEDIAKAFNQDNEKGSDPTKQTKWENQDPLAGNPGSLREKATNPNVVVTVAPDANGYVVTVEPVSKLPNGIKEADPIEIPDTWGKVQLDLNGNKILGQNGTSAADPDGKPAVIMPTENGKGTQIEIVDKSPAGGGYIKGGDAFKDSGGNGGDGIEIADDAATDVTVGKGGKVIGGNGADSPTKSGGNGGAGIDGDIVKNEGTIQGGNGGNTVAAGEDKKGGNGGAGVDGNVPTNAGKIEGGDGGNSNSGNGGDGGKGGSGVTGNVGDNKPNGTIEGGDGGDSKNKDGGDGGAGVDGNVNNNDKNGKIEGGDGGDSDKANGGAGGNGVSGNVTGTNAGKIEGGDGGDSKGGNGNGGAGGDGVEKDVNKNDGTINGGDGGDSKGGTGNGGAGGNGTGGNVPTNNGDINGGNGGNVTGGTGNGGAGGNGTGGNVPTNTGNITGGNGGNSSGGNGGNGGDGVKGNVPTTNTGNITGGNGGSATGATGNGGNGGKGVNGNVPNNTGKVTGGNGGNSAGGKGGSGGNAVGGTVGSGGNKNNGSNGTGKGDGGNGGDPTAGMSKAEKELYDNSKPLDAVDKEITSFNYDTGDEAGSNFSKLRLKAVGGNRSVLLTWKAQTDADGYIIYGSPCGYGNKSFKMRKIKTIKNPKTKKWNCKKMKADGMKKAGKLMKGKYYKFKIVAYKKFSNGETRVIAKSIGAHSVTKGHKKNTNPTGIKLKSKSKITVKKGKTKKIKATYTKPKGKKVKEHIKIVRFESLNKKVAKVDQNGNVKGVKKGKTKIFVYAQNGFYKIVNVTVN